MSMFHDDIRVYEKDVLSSDDMKDRKMRNVTFRYQSVQYPSESVASLSTARHS
jgi:hypothetical protein